MGEDSAMVYDQDLLFKHLSVVFCPLSEILMRPDSCFYLDTHDNAKKNGMQIDDTHEWASDIDKR